jgi:hypothetical protein
MSWNTFTALLYIRHMENHNEVLQAQINLNLPHWNCGHGLWSTERHTSLAGTHCFPSLHGLGSHGSLSEQLPNSKSASFSPAHLPHKQLWFSCLQLLSINIQSFICMYLWQASHSHCVQHCLITKIQLTNKLRWIRKMSKYNDQQLSDFWSLIWFLERKEIFQRRKLHFQG